MDKIDPEQRFDGKWCWDSDTGEKLLINMASGQVIIRGKNLKDMVNSTPENRILAEAKMWEEGFNDGYKAASQDFEATIWDLSDQIAWLREEQEYLLKLNRRSDEDVIQ